MRRIVDISVPLRAGIASDPPGLLPEIDYFDHHDTADDVLAFFPGAQRADLPDEEGWALERVRISTHNGTHLDAPWHFSATMDGDQRAITIDEVPLEWCFNDAIKLDFLDKPDGYVCSADDVKRALEAINYKLKPLDIVLMNTSAGKAYGQPDFIDRGCGFGREATLFLLNQGVRVTGTNGWSWDAPFSFTARRFKETGDASLIWEGHKAGREIGYCHMEKLSNLDALPSSGFKVACFPVKIEKASAGWTRAVAIIED
jgi:kynurenine formamidase